METIGRIGYRVSSVIRQFIYYLGFIISRIPDKNRLASYTEEIRNHELKKLSHSIMGTNSQKLYNRFLKKYNSNWTCGFSSSKFIGEGLGEQSLNVFRKICYDKHDYFEKVYFNNSIDLKRLLWFYEHFYPLLNPSIKTPKLEKVIKGEFLTIVYFAYIDQAPLSKDVLHSSFLEISRIMYLLSKKNKESINCAPGFIKNYASHYHYADKIAQAEVLIKKLSNNMLSKKKIEQIIESQPLIITHGDIYYTNVLSDSYIIDWDSFGIYPHGFETAFILANSTKDLTFERIEEILIEEYRNVVVENLWSDFQLSCFYFYLIFTVKDANNTFSLSRQKNVFRKVEKLYYEKTRRK